MAHCLVCTFSPIGHGNFSSEAHAKVEKTWFRSINFRLLSHLYHLFVAFRLTSSTRGLSFKMPCFGFVSIHRIHPSYQQKINGSLNHEGCPALNTLTLCLCTDCKVLLHLASNKLHVLSTRLCYGSRFITLVNVTEQVSLKIWGKSRLVSTIKSAVCVNFTSHKLLCEHFSAFHCRRLDDKRHNGIITVTLI